MWPFSSNHYRRKREEDRRVKIAASQLALLEAATNTADTAQHVTSKLRKHLEDSVRQFQSTARLVADALIICDSSGRIIGCNPASETIFGFSARDITANHINRLFHLDRRPITDLDVLWRSIEEGADEGDNALLRGYRSTGQSFPIDVSLTRLGRQDGTTLILLIICDLSHQVDPNKPASLHSDRFRSLFNLSFDSILIIQDGNIVAANKAAAHTFGVERDALLKMPSKQIFDGEIQTLPTETEGKRGDGTNIRLMLSSTDLTWNGNPAHLVTVKDVSELRQLYQAIQNIDNSRNMICVFDKKFKIKFANWYFIDYYGCWNPVGRSIRDLIPTSDRDTFSLKLMSLTPENPTMRHQVQHIPAVGPPRFLDWIDHAVFDANGDVIEYQRTGRDITSVLTSMANNPI